MQTLPKKCVDFVARVVEQIRSKKVRASTEEELSSHLLDSIEGLQKRGLPEEESVELSLLRMGDPAELGKSIRLANRPVYARFSFIAVTLILISVPAFIAGMRWLEQQFTQVIIQYNEKLDQYEGLFWEDQKLLAQTEFFGGVPENKSDAGPLLNPRVVWASEQVANGWPELEFPRSVKKLFVLQKTKPWLLVDGPELRAVDLKWMKDLKNFDHWDLYASDSPARTNMLANRMPFSAPVPELNQLSDFAKVRLIRGLQERKPLEALREVRNFARLIYSTEILIGPMVAIGILNLERTMYEEAVKRKMLSAGAWEPVPADITFRARRAIYGMPAFMQLTMPLDKLREFLKAPYLRSAICATHIEAASQILLTKNYLEPKFPFETDYGEKLALLRSAINSTPGCRSTHARRVINMNEGHEIHQPIYYSMNPTEFFFSLFSIRYGYYIPYLRRAVGTAYLSYATPDYINSYRRDKNGLMSSK